MPSLVLLYDADCGFCTRAVSVGRRLGCRYDATPYQAWPHLAEHGITEVAAGEALHAVSGDRVLIGHEAVAAGLRTSTHGAVRLLGRALASRPVRPLGAWSYAVVARHRHQLPGGTPTCALEEKT